MHTSRSIITITGILALLGGVSWQALHPPIEAKSVPQIASEAAPRKAPKPETIPTPRAKNIVTKTTQAQALAQVKEPTPGAQPEAKPARQENTWDGPATAEVLVAVEETLKGLSAEEREGIRLVSASCKTAACRIDLAAADAQVMDSFLTALPFTLGWEATTNMEHVNNPDGSVSTTVYLERDDAGPAES